MISAFRLAAVATLAAASRARPDKIRGTRALEGVVSVFLGVTAGVLPYAADCEVAALPLLRVGHEFWMVPPL